MVKLKGQAFDTEEIYGQIGLSQLEEYAKITGLIDCTGRSIDVIYLLEIMQNSSKNNPQVLEVGCGYGRIGQHFISEEGIRYYGIDLHKPFVDFFRQNVKSSKKRARIFHGNYLDYAFPFKEVDYILFPWSVIGDFGSGEGQVAALKKSRGLLASEGKILLDVPVDIMNKFEGYTPGCFNIPEEYNLQEISLRHTQSYPYITNTSRNRKIIEISS